MTKFDYKKVETAIGYHFNNPKLLKQAFFRSSFAHENNRESNEILEFIGDEVLDLAVTRFLLEKYSKSNDGTEYFKSNKQEGELTKIKSELVRTDYLASSFNKLNLDMFIYYGKNDVNNNVKNVLSVKEDVLEAIFGAVALDSDYDMEAIMNMANRILGIKEFLKNDEMTTNYVGLLQEKTDELDLDSPDYYLEIKKENNEMVWHAIVSIKGIKSSFEGKGYKQKDAKKDAAKRMLQFINKYEKELLKKKKMQENREDVFASINELVQSGTIEKPVYEFEIAYDDNGNPEWKCSTTIEELGYIYFGYGTTKKDAQYESLKIALKEIERSFEE